MVEYKGTVALVTGAGSGIGKALAEALVSRGARVVVADIDATNAKRVAAELGNAAHAIVCDLAEPTAANRLVEDSFALHDRLDLICSNAGIARADPLLDEALDSTDVERLFSVNLFAGFRIAQAYARLLKRAGARGRLMLTGSENSLSVPSNVMGAQLGLYGATKHGLLVLAEWLRGELAAGPFDLHVLLPGGVYTAIVARVLKDPSKAPPELGLISSERCAELALRGIDRGLFYIPTHAHLADDMRPRFEGIARALEVLDLTH